MSKGIARFLYESVGNVFPRKNPDANRLTVRVKVKGRRIDYDYDVSGPWREAFILDDKTNDWFVTMNGVHRFFVEYDADLTGIPKSLAVIPFLSNVLPMAWFYDAEIVVPELDHDFYHCLPAVKAGMQERHPTAKLGGRIIAKRLVKNVIDSGENAISLFSGGVDATFTAVSNLESKPILTTVWGADIYLIQEKEWSEVASQNRQTAKQLGLNFSSIKSSFRSFLDYATLKKNFDVPLGMPSWWYSVQHSIALVSMAAPLAWAKKANHIYIASSYSVEDDPETKCCNWPNIDGNVKYAGLSVTHHDFEVTRQKKVEAICRFFEANRLPMNLRVCWKAVAATNCCACEKCARTIYGIIAEKHDPNNFGFRCDDAAYEKLEADIKSGKIRVSSFWDAVVDRIKTNLPDWQSVSHIAAVVAAHEKATLKNRAKTESG